MTRKNTSIGEIVAVDFRTAELFKEAEIDFCCGGKMTLQEACDQKGLNTDEFIEKLNSITEIPDQSGRNYSDWDLGFLCDYIVNTHHKYVRKALPDLDAYTKKIASVHGDIHPELIEVARLFGLITTELTQHLEKEEEVLFPAIRKAEESSSNELKSIISSEILRMRPEHDFAGGTMDEIHQITKGYKLPESACNTYQVCFQMLSQFEDDLHIHVHLENNILYKKALEL